MNQDPTKFEFIDDEHPIADIEEDPRSTRSHDRVSNEFATIETALIEVPGGALLRLYDVRHGKAIVLDALQLEAITRLELADFVALVDPNFKGITNGRDGRHLAAVREQTESQRDSGGEG